MAEKTVKALPLVPAQYDSVNESINRRTIEQALQDLYSEVGHVKDMQESGISKAVKRHIFLLMGASHCCFNGGSISMMLTALAGIKLPDNEKAIFGTGGDLEIYHEAGVGSWIKEVGAGDLNIQAHDNLRLQNTASENYLKADSNGAVTLYYDNVAKIATTSTGIDVTGTVTSDGLTVDGNVNVQGDGKEIFLKSADYNVARIIPRGTGSNLDKGLLSLFDTGTEDVRIDTAGSSWFLGGSIGIGVNSPNYLLSLQDSNGADLGFSNSSALSNGDYLGRIYGTDSSNNFFTGINMFYHDSNDGEIRFRIKTAGTNTDVMTLVDGGVTVASTSPGITVEDTDATSTYNKIELQNAGGSLNLNTRQSNGTFVSTDYQIIKNAAGANIHKWFIGGSEKLRLDASGRLGINTTSLDAPLTIHNSADPEIRVGYNSSQDHRITWDSAKLFLDADPDNANSNSILGFRVDGTERLRIQNTGGISFNGDTAAANALDDYEEGTFTLTTAGDSTGAFNGTPTCHYTKIGNMVTVLIAFRVGTNFSSNLVGGLPFTTSHSGMVSSFINTGQAITSTSNTISTTAGNSGTTIRLHNNQNTGDSHNPNTTAEYYRLNFTYKAA